MSPQARLETQQLLTDLVLLVTMATAGAAAFDQRTRLEQIEPEAKFAQTFMLACLNQRTFIVGKDQVGVICQTF